MTKELIALLDGKKTGRVVRDNRGKLAFIYNEQWRNAPTAYPLSLSMPLTLAEHPNAKIDPFLSLTVLAYLLSNSELQFKTTVTASKDAFAFPIRNRLPSSARLFQTNKPAVYTRAISASSTKIELRIFKADSIAL
jgi:HipA-like protein